MKLTKEQDKLATRLRDAGIPGEFAVLVASRATFPHKYRCLPNTPSNAVLISLVWKKDRHGDFFWHTFHWAWQSECEARGIK